MTGSRGWLRVEGSEIVDGRGELVRLRGFCLGGWLNMENFIIGYPGHESGVRAAVSKVLGEDRARFFFERFVDHFIREDDLAFIRDLGCNVIRIPFNYRHFECDDRPFEYRPEGLGPLDRVIGWARCLGLYVILDLHAVQGWQNRGWHCDNGCREAHFWGQKAFEDRAIALWEYIACRYRSEPTVAGYNLMNEPDAEDAIWLNHFYRRATEAIRAIDPDHILFLEGNRYSQNFEQLDPPFDRNLVYSSHNYAIPATEWMPYPGEFMGEFYDRPRLEREYLERTVFMQTHNVPNWVGEFGAIFAGDAGDASRLRVLSDQIDIIESQGHHWTLWTYKDIGKMGLVCPDPESEWMQRTRPVREAKRLLRCDHWIEKESGPLDPLLEQIAARAQMALPKLDVDKAKLESEVNAAVCEVTFSQALLPAFAEQFRGMTESEIDCLMQSFAFGNCRPREAFVELLREQLGTKVLGKEASDAGV